MSKELFFNEVIDKNIVEIKDLLNQKKFSSYELTSWYCDWIEYLDSDLNALIYFDREAALSNAREADKRIAKGEERDLLGIPILIKDNISTANIVTTAGSRMLIDYIPPYDATVVSRLKDEGAVILAKTNMDEFAMGSSGENSFFGAAKNPWDLERVPGGSSSGSVVGVASYYANIALGSDTGGSVRQPASLTGLVGLKPTYGRVSRYGLIALGSSFDQIGPISRRVEDSALLLKVIAGRDKYDSTSADKKVDEYDQACKENINGIKIGLVKELYEGVDIKMLNSLQKTVKDLESRGAIVEEVSMPVLKYSLAVYYIIQSSECSTNLARFDGVRYGFGKDNENNEDIMQHRRMGFGKEVKRRIMLGTYSLSSGYYDDYFKKASEVRRKIVDDWQTLFDSYDVVMGLVSPVTAFKVGEKNDNPLEMYLSDVMTVGVSVAGLPALSVPGEMVNGLPVGIQLVGNYFDEASLLKVAYNLQMVNKWYKNIPQYINNKIVNYGKSAKV